MGLQDEIKARAFALGRLSPSQMDTAVQRQNEMKDRLAEVKTIQNQERRTRSPLQRETHHTAAHTNLRPALGNQLHFYKRRKNYRIVSKDMCDWEL